MCGGKMKRLIIALGFVTLLFVGIEAKEAFCWNCPPRVCYYDLDCGIGCWCYKGRYELTGVCVTK